ncbi:MAG: FHA domain-containing protein [Anaerolineae bacterium]|nr:FHA domain-containing protein [Anaerolineae bacterium]
MAFGRLDVYWPDGPIEIYQLEKPVIGIGRQRGNDIVLETDAVSRYHAKMRFHDAQCHVEDLGSVNGTYVDGIRLQPNMPCQLLGGEELQIGDVRAIYHPPADSEATTSAHTADETQVLEVVKPTFRVTLEGVEQVVSPGMHVTPQLLIENLGAQADRYFIELDGVPKEWVRVNAAEVLLEAEQSTYISISIKLPRRPDSAAGTYLVNVHVRAGSRPAQTVSAEMSLVVLPFHAFGMRLGDGPFDVDAPFPVHVHNQGNVALDVELRGEDDHGALQFEFQPAALKLQPGQRVSAMAKVGPGRARRPPAAGVYPFNVVAVNYGPAGWQAAVPGRVRIPEAAFGAFSLPGRSSFVVGAAAVGLLIVIVLMALVLLQPAPPQIVAEPVVASPVDRAPQAGDDLLLAWEVQNASELTLQVIRNGQALETVPLAVDARQHTYLLTGAGQYKFVLAASAGDQSAGAELLVAVAPAITHFAAAPTNLVQGIEENLTLWWETRGATSVQIAGLEVLLCDPAGYALAPQGPQSFRVCPRDAGKVALQVIAQSEGMPDRQGDSIEVVVDKAMCRVLGSEALLYLPGAVTEAPRTLATGAAIHILARDPSDAWMLVAVPAEGVTGWLQRDEAVDCSDVSLLSLMVNDTVAPPAPAPTATLTPFPTATATLTVTPTGWPTLTPFPTASPVAKPPVNSGR